MSFILGSYQAERMEMPKGQCKLVLRKDGKWFLIVIVEVPGRNQDAGYRLHRG